MLVLILVTSIAGGYALYRSNVHWFETNKSDETTTALRLVEAMVANYTDVRSSILGENAPVPAEFRAHAIDRFNAARDSEHQLRMAWLGLPGRAIATEPMDALTAEAILDAARIGRREARSEWLAVDGDLLFRTLAPSVAIRQACVDCHNRYLTTGEPWSLGNVMGAFVIDVPAEGFLVEARRDAVLAGSALFLVLASLSGLILFLQQRRLDAELQASSSTAQARADAEARRNAEAASHTKSRFLALMSHELRTPLNAIIGFSEIMMRQTMGPISERYADYAQDIHRSGQHLLTIITDILDLARAESGHLRLTSQETTLEDTVRPCLSLIRTRAEQRGISVTTSYPGDLRLLVDPTKLRQALLNLLSNAVKFTPEGGHVEVTAVMKGDGGLAISVSDSGMGISPEEIPQALTPFERLKAAENIEGTGLGLPLAKELIELHGGRLELSSQPGRGTRVTLHLPAECLRPAQDPAGPADPAGPPGPLSGGVTPGLAAMAAR